MRSRALEEKQAKWQNLVKRQRESGLSIQKWCQQNQIRPSTFQYWKDKFFPKQLEKSSFTELNIKRSDPITLQTRGLFIRIGNDCDLDLRKTLFAMLGDLAC